MYHNVIGKLVETTVTSILHSVLSLEDITEIESQRIGSTLARVEGLGQLFQPDPALVSTAAAFVPHWIKFGYLIKILVSTIKALVDPQAHVCLASQPPRDHVPV